MYRFESLGRFMGQRADIPCFQLPLSNCVTIAAHLARGGRPILDEPHGVEGASGPRVFKNSVPYPSRAKISSRREPIPSSRSLLGGGLPVHITNVRKLAGGRIAFLIGYEYQ